MFIFDVEKGILKMAEAKTYVMRCAIWYHLNNFKNMKTLKTSHTSDWQKQMSAHSLPDLT